jgi:hypothetical protein
MLTRRSSDVFQTISIYPMTIILNFDSLTALLQADPTFYTGSSGIQGVLYKLVEYLCECWDYDRRSQTQTIRSFEGRDASARWALHCPELVNIQLSGVIRRYYKAERVDVVEESAEFFLTPLHPPACLNPFPSYLRYDM